MLWPGAGYVICEAQCKMKMVLKMANNFKMAKVLKQVWHPSRGRTPFCCTDWLCMKPASPMAQNKYISEDKVF